MDTHTYLRFLLLQPHFCIYLSLSYTHTSTNRKTHTQPNTHLHMSTQAQTPILEIKVVILLCLYSHLSLQSLAWLGLWHIKPHWVI